MGKRILLVAQELKKIDGCSGAFSGTLITIVLRLRRFKTQIVDATVVLLKLKKFENDKKILNAGYLTSRKGYIMIYKSIPILRLMFILTFVITSVNAVRAGDERNMAGWGVDDPYHKHYQVVKFEKLKAKVLRIKEVIPMPGMAPGVAMDVEADGDTIEVQICPTWFMRPDEIGITPGDRVSIRGVRANINNKNVFMASKIKKEDYFELKVRFTKDGIPFWTMTPGALFEANKKERDPENNR